MSGWHKRHALQGHGEWCRERERGETRCCVNRIGWLGTNLLEGGRWIIFLFPIIFCFPSSCLNSHHVCVYISLIFLHTFKRERERERNFFLFPRHQQQHWIRRESLLFLFFLIILFFIFFSQTRLNWDLCFFRYKKIVSLWFDISHLSHIHAQTHSEKKGDDEVDSHSYHLVLGKKKIFEREKKYGLLVWYKAEGCFVRKTQTFGEEKS